MVCLREKNRFWPLTPLNPQTVVTQVNTPKGALCETGVTGTARRNPLKKSLDFFSGFLLCGHQRWGIQRFFKILSSLWTSCQSSAITFQSTVALFDPPVQWVLFRFQALSLLPELDLSQEQICCESGKPFMSVPISAIIIEVMIPVPFSWQASSKKCYLNKDNSSLYVASGDHFPILKQQ